MEAETLLLALLTDEDGISIHKACKKLGLAMSEMMRLLSVLGPAAQGGMGLVERREEGARTRLFMTTQGRALCVERGGDESRITRD